MGSQNIVISGGNHEWGICLLSIILLLVASASATFDQIINLSLDDVPGVWRGIPKVTIVTDSLENKNCHICVDDTYWSSEIADSICQYFGFEGSMIVQTDTTPSEPDLSLDGYAVCSKLENSNLPLACEFRDHCERYPTISCLLPGYEGCYPHTDTNPFFSDGTKADLSDRPINVQTCAASCPDSPYLGLTNGQDCICGSVLGDSSDVGVCDLECQGDDLQSCGGDNAIIVYSADVIGHCGNSEPMELIPNQPLYIASPGFPDSYGESRSEACTWSLDIDVPALHNLEIFALYDLKTRDRLTISADSLRLSYGSKGRARATRHPHNRIQDTITVSFTFSQPVPSDTGFFIKFSLTPNSMYSGPTSLPVEYTTSEAESVIKLSKLGIYAAVGVILLVLLV